MSLEKTASAIARAIFDRIERDGNIVLANIEEAALSVLAVEAERRKATMTELSPVNRHPSLADMERRLVEATRREKEHQDRVRAAELMQYMIAPGPIAQTLRDYAIKQGLVPDRPRMTNAAGAVELERMAERYKLRPSGVRGDKPLQFRDPADRGVPVPQEVLDAQAKRAKAGVHGLAPTMVIVDEASMITERAWTWDEASAVPFGIDLARPGSDSVKVVVGQPDGAINEIRPADVARNGRASS